MRHLGWSGLLLAACALAAAACSGGPSGDDDDDHLRAGSLVMTRSAIAGFTPEETLTGVAAFFDPPGPATSPGLVNGECHWATPEPSATGTPEPAEIAWRDAGESLTLRSDSGALGLARVDGANGEILYLTRADALPESFATDMSYDIEIDGSDAPNGVPGMTLPGALLAPEPIGLYAPDFTLAPIPYTQAPMQLGWSPGKDPSATAIVRVIVSGTTGTATLSCATEDQGFFEVSALYMEQFPPGGGTVTVSRTHRVSTKLTGSEWIDADTVLIEGGTILLEPVIR